MTARAALARRRRVLPLIVGTALAAAVVVHVGTGPVLDGLRALSPAALAAALALGLLTTAASAARWTVVARA
ncbi:MAG TPA: hypothetical protein VGH76_14330, partial [Actinomycetospora sp.]